MKKGKKLTYVNLPADDTFDAGYEKALEQVLTEAWPLSPDHHRWQGTLPRAGI